jgi:LysM repeat protein
VYLVQVGDTMEHISSKYAISVQEILKNNTHISEVLSPGLFLYLPGIKSPVIATASMNRENLELSVSGSFAHKLKLINPN